MASINQGDDAVERLDNAVTAFEQIMTGPEGQTVAVPGHQPQPTLAERVKQNLKPSTDAAAGYATQAAASAKAAADAAKLASQISGLETVADAIGMAALPLPDVWAPLSDSLRLITGYGREVKAGDDVVARMVNFSRNSTATYIGKDGQLKTAAANEPRFEREGLLIEGQSTNLIPISNFPQNLAGWTAPNPTGNLYSYVNAPDGSANALKASFSGDGLHQSFPSLVVGTTYTFSFYAKNDTPTPVVSRIRIGTGGSTFNVTIPENTGWARYQVTQTFVTGDTLLRWYFTTKNIEVSLWGAQLEALPFSSSYIQTNGYAVTRAADICSIVKSSNFPADGVSAWAVTVSQLRCDPPSGVLAVVSMDALSPSRHTWFNNVDSNCMPASGSLRVGTFSAVAPKFGIGVLALSTSKTEASCMSGGVITKIPIVNNYQPESSHPIRVGSRIGGSDGSMYGHVRNLRIWHRALTDDQLKAIA